MAGQPHYKMDTSSGIRSASLPNRTVRAFRRPALTLKKPPEKRNVFSGGFYPHRKLLYFEHISENLTIVKQISS
jgi:hypothetical protein